MAMAARPDIRRFRTLQKVGVFQNYRCDPALPDFRRYNLVYGFNGTGKTTLSRILRGLDGGNWRSILPPKARVEIELSDGSVLTPDSDVNALQRRVLVFNLDFINENLRWSEGRVNPVFYLGKDATSRAGLLQRIERRIPIRAEQRRQAQSSHSANERALNAFYTTTARLLAEMLGLGRHYDARHLKHDYESGAIGTSDALSEDEREARKALIRQPSAYSQLSLPELNTQALKTALQEARQISEATLSDLRLVEMQQHPSMVPWLKTGFDYHREHNLNSCLFCANNLTNRRLTELKNGLDERFDRFVAGIEEAVGKLRQGKQALRAFLTALPDERVVSATLSRDYKEATRRLRASIADAEEMFDQAVSAASSKGTSPSRSNWPDQLRDARKVATDVGTLRREAEQVRSVISRHNAEQDKFADHQARAREELKLAVLAEYTNEHEALRRTVEIATKALEIRKRLHTKLVECAAALRSELRDHGPAVGRINALLHAYLGHNEICLELSEEGYRILRHGEVITAPLSEGEATAIALCYFLSKLKEEGRNLDEQIIVVDDPVSSLDAGSLNYAFNLLRGMLENAQQLIVFTHNLALMNEMKKWLRRPREEGKASFFYLRTWHDKEQYRRHATIIEMPKLLRGYDSEYQYLFYLVRKCKDEGAESPNIPGYIMPNVIRRVLELFLAFKVPGSEGLGDKINRPLVQHAGLDQARLQALNRLTQVESHSDSLDDFVGFSSMTIEETHQAGESVLKLVEVLDRDHYGRMCELSN